MVFKNENCTFSDGAIGSVGIQYINIPKDVLDTLLRYNSKLEEEVRALKGNQPILYNVYCKLYNVVNWTIIQFRCADFYWGFGYVIGSH